MKNTITTLLILFCLNVFSQNKAECEKLLSQEINIENMEKFQNDFSNFKNCGLDSVDLEIFSNNSFLATILITLSSETKNDKITYETLLNKLLDFKKSEQYPKIREVTLISKELSNKIAKIENWNEDKIKLEKLEIPESSLIKMHDFVKENSDSKTYKEIFMVLNEEQNKNKVNNLKKSEEYSDIFTNYGNADLADLLKKANAVNKPLIIYFTGYACVNARKIEENILTEDLIYEQLKNQFYFVSLYVDDKKQLDISKQFTSSSTGKLIKTIGQKHSNLQIEKFNVNMQPYFAILDSKGNVIATESYTSDENNFMNFLNKGLNTK